MPNPPATSKVLPRSSFPDLRLAHVEVSQGRHMPHWEAAGAIYHISLHLADSVPVEQRQIWLEERARLRAVAEQEKRPLTADEVAALRAVYDERVERYLSSGCGECLLRLPIAADALASVLEYGNGSAYALHAWTIMPNHLHVVVGGFDNERPMTEILQVWKRTSSHRINQICGRNGTVWHDDAYTRIIRDEAEYRRQLSYVWNNPESAGLDKGFRRERYVKW